MKLFLSLARFKANRSGTSAIEFALIVPALVVAIIGISDVTDIAIGSSRMQTAVRASIQYAMNGGTDMSAAQSIGTQTWTEKPSGGTLTVSSSCTCGSAAGTCGSLCADGTVPQSYVSAIAQATLGGSTYHIHKTVTETVRLR